MTVDEVFRIDREADIMCAEPERIQLDHKAIRVQAASLNEVYTIASCGMQPKRRSQGGRFYDHLIYVQKQYPLMLAFSNSGVLRIVEG